LIFGKERKNREKSYVNMDSTWYEKNTLRRSNDVDSQMRQEFIVSILCRIYNTDLLIIVD
jgi:hypothetical protein